MASSRPWSPVTSSVSTTYSSSHHGSSMPSVPYPPLPSFRPPSRSQTPSRAFTPGVCATPRPRAKTPTRIPGPTNQLKSIVPPQSDGGYDDDEYTTVGLQRVFSPTSSSNSHPPRPPSRSMIPVLSVHVSPSSRPSSSLSNHMRAESPPSAFRSSAARAQTPESTMRARVQQMPFYPGTPARSSARPSLAHKLPPSSFRDGSVSRTPSRAGSRAGAYTPSMDTLPLHEYVPGNLKDPLDAEVAFIVNSIAHGLLIERVDPPPKKIPKEGEEIKAQYAFSNALSRKVITCRLTTLTRPGKANGDMTTKKVMCRVGGGWQDLSHYILNRQAGM